MTEDCGSVYGDIQSVSVTDCPDDENTCILKKGTDILITVNFTSKAPFEKIITQVGGEIMGLELPFFGVEQNACKAAISCPGKKGEKYTYVEHITVRKSYPLIDVTVIWRLLNENNDTVACIKVPSKIE